MPSPAFYATDFKVFNEPGFRARMAAIRERIRPKLEAVGHSLAPAVGRATGGEAFAHVAKHARRTINPPDDTWVAFGPDARGYKKHCHFKVAISRHAVRFLFEVGPEHGEKKRWATTRTRRRRWPPCASSGSPSSPTSSRARAMGSSCSAAWCRRTRRRAGPRRSIATPRSRRSVRSLRSIA